MSLSPRGNYTPRRVREQRAYALVVTGGVAAAVAVVTFVLALVGIGSLGLTFLAVIIAVACLLLFRRTVGR